VRLSPAGLFLIKKFEGLHKLNKNGIVEAYLDPVGIPTIGYGHIDGVQLGQVISPIEADIILLEDIKQMEGYLTNLVKVELLQQEFDALVSFVFNVGPTNLGKSQLLKFLNSEDKKSAAQCLLSWDKAKLKQKLVTLPGLTKRRLAEMHLFLEGPDTLYDENGEEDWTTTFQYTDSAHILITTNPKDKWRRLS
jgi:GH24 family phage-related lysozyme (muramidase)